MTVMEVMKLARVDLACYAIAVFPKFELAAHHRLMVDKLEAVERGEIRRLMMFLPPRHGKSLLGTQIFPAWFLGRHPDRSIITASYGQELADDFGRNVRNMVNDSLHRAIFPEFCLADDATSMRRFSTTAGGLYYAVGRGGPITGRGAHLLLIDDVIKDAQEARSEVTRRALYEWFSSVAYTRLQPGGAIVLISTRWHQDDLAGRLLQQDPKGWDVLCLRAIAEVDESFRRAGDALWTEQFPLEDLEKTREVIGSAAFESLNEQTPAAAEKRSQRGSLPVASAMDCRCRSDREVVVGDGRAAATGNGAKCPHLCRSEHTLTILEKCQTLTLTRVEHSASVHCGTVPRVATNERNPARHLHMDTADSAVPQTSNRIERCPERTRDRSSKS